MGNSKSNAKTDYVDSIEKILDELSYSSPKEINLELRTLAKDFQFEYKEISALVRRIYSRAWLNDNKCLKYVELANHLSNFTFYQTTTKQNISFKDVFLSYVMERFEDLKSPHLYSTESESKANFFAQLFNGGLVSSTLMIHWINSLVHRPSLQHTILTAIKHKISSEFKQPVFDKEVSKLWQMLVERNMIQPGVTLPQSAEM